MSHHYLNACFMKCNSKQVLEHCMDCRQKYLEQKIILAEINKLYTHGKLGIIESCSKYMSQIENYWIKLPEITVFFICRLSGQDHQGCVSLTYLRYRNLSLNVTFFA